MRLAIAGCTGRMGLALLAGVAADPKLTLSGGSVRPGSGLNAGALMARHGLSDVYLTEDVAALAAQSDALIDFTTPSYSMDISQACRRAGTVHICGTTGLDAAQKGRLQEAGQEIPVVWAANMSIGVTLFSAMVEQVAGILDEAYDIEIVEMHHRHKKDAPSGTALALGQAAATGRGVDFEEQAVYERSGERTRGAIGFASLRGGDVIGDHSVIFAGPGERFELTHRAASREIYVRGALMAARWAVNRPPGFYGMREVLGLG